jgi:hypothetical protein
MSIEEVCLLYSPGCGYCKKFREEPTGWMAVKKLLPPGTTASEVDVSKVGGRHPYMHPSQGGVPQVAYVVNGKAVDWHIGYTNDPFKVASRVMLLDNQRLQYEAHMRQDYSGQMMLQRAERFLQM